MATDKNKHLECVLSSHKISKGHELLDKYVEHNKLNLYVYSQFGKIEGGSDRLRSNVKAQIENIRSNAEKGSVRQMIRVVKVWKINKGSGPKSLFLELIIIKAFDKKDITG